MATAAILTFTKMVFWTLMSNEYCMTNVYSLAKFYTNIFIGHRDMTQKGKSTMAATAILNFIESGIYWATVILVRPVSVCILNLMQICSFVTDIWPKIQTHDSGSRHLEFYQKWDFWPQ